MSEVLVCPVCRHDVRPGSSMCLSCHLPMKDAVVAWCAYRLPDTLPFVAPGAAAGLFLHAVKGRPWLGLLAAALIVVAIPALLWPSMLTGAFSDLANGG